MPQFRNKSTGAVITANGPVADHYSRHDGWEEVKSTTKKAAQKSPAKKAAAKQTADAKESDK